ncbi:MAG: response regulator [Candidatus Aminicenantes bacterium]
MAEKKIVVVDDDDIIRKTFFMILHKKYSVYLAKDAEEALCRFQREDIDLIITDLKLPRLSGLEMIAAFRKNGYKGDVILISAYPDLLQKDDLRRFSIEYFFIKPLDLKALEQSIDSLIRSEGSQSKKYGIQPCTKR